MKALTVKELTEITKIAIANGMVITCQSEKEWLEDQACKDPDCQ